MKKYTTKPIDFTGCHPVIAEALKRGEAIECFVWDGGYGKAIGVVVGYSAKNKYPYRSDDAGVACWQFAEPIPRKVRRIMPPERAIPVLIENGWKFKPSGQMDGPAQTIQTIFPSMLCRMGARLDDPDTTPWDTTPWSWPSCIIEECDE